MKENKGFLAVVGVILLIIALVLIFLTPKYEEFNKVELTSTTHIFNLTQQSYLDTIVDVALVELEVQPQVIVIKDMAFAPPNVGIPGKELLAFVYGEGGTYIIYVKKMSRVQSIGVLSHELIHLRDMEKGELLTGKNLVVYRGVRYVDSQIPEYDFRPWEIVAFEDSRYLEDILMETLYE